MVAFCEDFREFPPSASADTEYLSIAPQAVLLEMRHFVGYDGVRQNPRLKVAVCHNNRKISVSARFSDRFPAVMVPQILVTAMTDGELIEALNEGLEVPVTLQLCARDGTLVIWTTRAIIWDHDDVVLGRRGFFDRFHLTPHDQHSIRLTPQASAEVRMYALLSAWRDESRD